MASLPDDHKVAAFRGVATEMAGSDTVGLSERLAEMPKGPVRDAGIGVLLGELRRSDPEMAAAWEKELTRQPENK